MIRRTVFICALLVLFAVCAAAQKAKPWTEWSDKEAEKILNDSAWGQTQTEAQESSQPGSTSAITSTTAARERNVRSADAAGTAESGERKEPMAVHYHVRLLSAKPIRAAFVRKIELGGAPTERLAQLKPWVDAGFADYIVVTITMDGTDQKRQAAAGEELMSGDVELLKATTFLERKDGKKVALMAYRAPGPDQLGAKFVFPRTVEGKPFVDPGSGEIRFSTELGKLKISRRFKISEMTYDGKLEF